MCGPLMILLSPKPAGPEGAEPTGLRFAAVRVHLGRLLSYAVIGGGLSFISAVLALEIDGLPARRVIMIVAGVVLLLSGLSTLGLPLLSR